MSNFSRLLESHKITLIFFSDPRSCTEILYLPPKRVLKTCHVGQIFLVYRNTAALIGYVHVERQVPYYYTLISLVNSFQEKIFNNYYSPNI